MTMPKMLNDFISTYSDNYTKSMSLTIVSKVLK